MKNEKNEKQQRRADLGLSPVTRSNRNKYKLTEEEEISRVMLKMAMFIIIVAAVVWGMVR